MERVAREIHILKMIRHPHIIQLYEIIETPKQLYLIMEYASGGELFDFILRGIDHLDVQAQLGLAPVGRKRPAGGRVADRADDGAGLERIALGYNWRRIAPPLIAQGEVETAHLQAARELGQTLAAGLAYGAY